MKLVKESLLEFTVDNPYAAMGIGRRVLIEQWLNKYEIKNYTINDDLTIDVNGSVDLDKKLNENLPDYIQFNIVYGYFDVGSCNLTSLRGCPRIIKKVIGYSGSFYCQDNKLTSLEGCPKEIDGNFECYNNKKQFTEEEVRALCKVKRDKSIQIYSKNNI